MSSFRKLDVEAYRRRRESMKTSSLSLRSTTITPPFSKQVLSYQELEQRTNNTMTPGILSVPKGPAAPSKSSSSSPLAQNIRQLILKSGDELSASSSIDKRGDASSRTISPMQSQQSSISAERRKRFVQQRVVEARNKSSALSITPVSICTAIGSDGSTSTAAFITPTSRAAFMKESARKSRTAISAAFTASTGVDSVASSSNSPPIISIMPSKNPPIIPSRKTGATELTSANLSPTFPSSSVASVGIDSATSSSTSPPIISIMPSTTPPIIPYSKTGATAPISASLSPTFPNSSVAKTANSSTAAEATISRTTTPVLRGCSISTTKNATWSGTNISATKTNATKTSTTKTSTTKTKTAKTTHVLQVRTVRSPLSPKNGTTNNNSRPRNDEYDEGPSTRRNLDKRSVRLRYGTDFSNEIDRHKTMDSPPMMTPKNNNSGNYRDDTLKVYVRKRPMFSQQLENGDFDVVRVLGGGSDLSSSVISTSAVVIYRTAIGADMRTKTVQPVVFSKCITAAFDHTVGSEHVYRTAVRPLLHSVLYESRPATLLMFGQTGSGKTYTMTACQKLVAAEIFATTRDINQVQVQCLELVGKKCRDLLNCETDADDVRIVDIDDGSVTFVNACTAVADSPRELMSVLVESQKRRATQSTEQNDVSSRSHAIYQIRTLDGNGKARGGVLTLLDCAGTERRNDSLFHSKERQAESAEINSSLYSLKECIRVRSRNAKAKSANQRVRVPYRSSNLTRVLRESLECSDAHLAVIAAVAPNATDTEHTIQTLTLLANLTGTDFDEGESQKLTSPTMGDDQPSVAPKKWNHTELVAWLSEQQLLLGHSPVPRQLDGSTLMRMSKIQLRNTFYGDQADRSAAVKKADLLFQSLRAESVRVDRLDMKRRKSSKSN